LWDKRENIFILYEKEMMLEKEEKINTDDSKTRFLRGIRFVWTA
jgi:hypothetical protein